MTREFEEQQRQWREAEEAKTAKNRAKRQKKKERARQGNASSNKTGGGGATQDGNSTSDAPLKKRRLVNGTEMVFKKPGEEGGESGEEDEDAGPRLTENEATEKAGEGDELALTSVPAVNAPKLNIIDDE